MGHDQRKIVTRFAPSPTGFMHVGSVRTALYAWLWARKNNGSFILRIEDTDKEREVAGSTEHIMECLRWLGFDWDEYFLQSERLPIYKKYAERLEKAGHAYPDPLSEEEVKRLRDQAVAERRPFLYREHRPAFVKTSAGKPEKWDGRSALRFRVPEIKSYKWHDIVYGDLSAGPEALDDFILIKADGYPTYNFAHIVDDIEMAVTHVMRGEEFISSTPKFLSVYEALGIAPPKYATLPHILGPSGKKKLSKRDGARDLLSYREERYLPDAFINFLALLGWNPGDDREIFSRNELTRAFELERIQKSGARMNEEKLDWINKEHLKKLPAEEIKNNILILLPEELRNEKIVPLIFERISKWGDVRGMLGAGELDFFIKRPVLKKEKLIYKNTPPEKIAENLKLAAAALKNISEGAWNRESVKGALTLIAQNLKNRGELLHPVRYALSGSDKSPDPFIISEILGKNETVQRLEKAI